MHTTCRRWRRDLAWVGLTALVLATIVGCARTVSKEMTQSAAEPSEATTQAVPKPTPPKGPAVGFNVGDRAPDFALPNGDGEIVSLSSYAGKPIVLVFYRGYW